MIGLGVTLVAVVAGVAVIGFILFTMLIHVTAEAISNRDWGACVLLGALLFVVTTSIAGLSLMALGI